MDIKSPLVSIIVPSYNYEKFIVEALDSISLQTYPNLELVIVDDMSKDSSVKLISQYISQKKVKERFEGNIKFIKHNVNRGAHYSINEGIRSSEGSYISILNADDLFQENRFDTMIDEMVKRNADFSFSKIEVINGDGVLLGTSSEESSKFLAIQDSINNFPSVGWSLVPHNAAISTGNMLFTREIFEKVGGFRNLKYCHDWDFILRSLIYTEPLYIPGTQYYYRLHGNNSYLKLNDVVDKEVKTVLGSFFYKCRTKKAMNKLCPSPQNWDGLFLEQIKRMSLHHFWLFSKTPINLMYQMRQYFLDYKGR
ncbi:glycosyltransferase [Paenibacillus sp. FSL H3-0469]|uniref:glycosyltransferase family 2 protein n=1 Tax=Paenibacillus sp. FSL H3-0469 TaxID=2954506 RepID=UPI0031011B7D